MGIGKSWIYLKSNEQHQFGSSYKARFSQCNFLNSQTRNIFETLNYRFNFCLKEKVCIRLKNLCICFHSRRKETPGYINQEEKRQRVNVSFYLSPENSFMLISYIFVLKQERPYSISSLLQCERVSEQTQQQHGRKNHRVAAA